MTVKSELMDLVDADGKLRPYVALEWAARHPQSEIHRHLEWDDTKAGTEYRLWQIRSLIALHIVTSDRKRQMLSLSIDRHIPGGGYRNIEAIIRDRTLRDVALADALAELERVQQKYQSLVELMNVWNEVGKVKRKARLSPARQSGAARSKARHSEARQA